MISQYEDFTEMMLSFMCKDCGIDTSPLGLDEYYMVHNEVWAQSGMDGLGGMLCLLCLEARLGRDLEVSDLMNIPMNKRIKEYING
jgi:hypothetical protein